MVDQEYLYVTGRLVQGDVFEPQTKNMQGGPLVTKTGEPKVQYFIAVAVAKTDQKMREAWNRIQAIAQGGFPGGQTARPDFAWKVIDGDAPQHAGKTGFPGCFVFRLSSGFSIKAYQRDSRGELVQVVDPKAIKRGYYVRAAFTCTPNGDNLKPGVYLNAWVVELVGYGEEIVSGPDGAALLGAAGAAVLPPGASSTPVASGAPPAMPGLPGMPPPAMPGIVPAPDFLKPPIMTPKANGLSYQQFIEQGWTKELLIQHGYMLP